MELLKEVISGSIQHCIIEMSACAGSCINGPAKAKHEKNRFRTKLELENSVKNTGMDFPSPQQRVPMGKRFSIGVVKKLFRMRPQSGQSYKRLERKRQSRNLIVAYVDMNPAVLKRLLFTREKQN